MVDSKTTKQGNDGGDSDRSERSELSFESAIAPNGPILGKLSRKQRNKLQYDALLKFTADQLKTLRKEHQSAEVQDDDDDMCIKDLSTAFRMLEEALKQNEEPIGLEGKD